MVVVAVAETSGDAAVELDEAVDGFRAAVGGAVGLEVAQERLLPLAQRLRTGRPIAGASTSSTSYRPWPRGTTRHPALGTAHRPRLRLHRQRQPAAVVPDNVEDVQPVQDRNGRSSRRGHGSPTHARASSMSLKSDEVEVP